MAREGNNSTVLPVFGLLQPLVPVSHDLTGMYILEIIQLPFMLLELKLGELLVTIDQRLPPSLAIVCIVEVIQPCRGVIRIPAGYAAVIHYLAVVLWMEDPVTVYQASQCAMVGLGKEINIANDNTVLVEVQAIRAFIEQVWVVYLQLVPVRPPLINLRNNADSFRISLGCVGSYHAEPMIDGHIPLYHPIQSVHIVYSVDVTGDVSADYFKQSGLLSGLEHRRLPVNYRRA